MRKILSLIFITVIGISSSFAKELEGTNLQAVKTVLEANLGVNEFEELQDQLNFLNRIERKIASYGDGISEEAKLICKLVIAKQKETAIGMDKLKKEDVQKKTSKPEKDPVKKLLQWKCSMSSKLLQKQTKICYHIFIIIISRPSLQQCNIFQ